jgi:uncharacterized protein (DUF58 family)
MSPEALKGIAEYITNMADKIAEFTKSPWFYVLVTLAVLGVLALILYRIYIALRNKRLGNIEYSREFSEVGVYEGDEVELIETVRNTSSFPLLWVDIESYFYNELELEEYERDPDDKNSMQYLISRFNLWPYMQIRRRHKVICKKRGHYNLHVASIYSKSGPLAQDAPAEIFVYPKAIPLDMQDFAQGRLQGDYVSRRPLYQDPFSFAGIRDYRFGDQISQINFKASARVPFGGAATSPFKVNSREFCASRRMMIYMDFHVPMGMSIDGAEYNRRAEQGLSFCAALVRDAAYGGFRVGFSANCKSENGVQALRFPCESGEAHMLSILKGMACMNLREGGSFASLLERAVTEGMSDTEILIVAFADNPEVQARTDALERLGNSVQVIILEGEEVLLDGE